MPSFTADALLVVHFLLAAFIVGGLVLVWIGAARGWPWVRNPWFRYAHLAAIVSERACEVKPRPRRSGAGRKGDLNPSSPHGTSQFEMPITQEQTQVDVVPAP